MEGWIKLHRKIISSPMYKQFNSKQRDVMIQCLLLANHAKIQWEWGNEIYVCNPGQFITSLESLRQLCANDIRVQSIRTALLKLERWGFLTSKSTNHGRLITICNWEYYQDIEINTNKAINKQLTNLQQTSNKPLTTNKNEKKNKNIKEEIYKEENSVNSDNNSEFDSDSDNTPTTPKEEKEKSSAQKEKAARAQKAQKFDLTDIADDIKPIMVDFIDYRKTSLKKPFKTQNGINGLCSKLQKLSGGNAAIAKIIAEYAKNREWVTVYMNDELQKEIDQLTGKVRKLPGVKPGYTPPKRKAANSK